MNAQTQTIEPAAPLEGDAAPANLPEVLPPAERHDGWTGARKAAFLRELSSCHCVSTAARAVGMSRQSAYRLRARLKGQPFDIAWQCAFRRQYDALAEAALHRALHGVEVPHFHKGELVHVSRRYDERLTVALLAMRERLAYVPRYLSRDEKECPPDDFESLLHRVEHGDERWPPIVYRDLDEDEYADDDEYEDDYDDDLKDEEDEDWRS